MRFGVVHRIMTSLLAGLGLLAVVASSALEPAVNLAIVIGGTVAVLIPESWQHKAWVRESATFGPLLLLALEGIRLFLGHSPIDIAVEFASLLQIFRIATRRGAAHDQQIILLALLHFVAGTVLGGGITFGLCFLGFLLVAPGALVLSHLRREVEGNYRQGARDRTGLPVDVPRILRSRRVVGRGFLVATATLSVPILLFTALLFMLFPRVGLSLLVFNHQRSGRMVGFSDRIDLGDVGSLRSDPTIALRFTLEGTPEPPPERLTLRLRGTAFDSYDGRAWSRTQTERKPIDPGYAGSLIEYPIRRRARGEDRALNIELEPLDPPVLFLPPNAVSFSIKASKDATALNATPNKILAGPEGEYRYTSNQGRGMQYVVHLPDAKDASFRLTLNSVDRARYLQSPANLPTRIAELGATWTREQASPRKKAEAIQKKLQSEYTYDLGAVSGGQSQPVDHFLFETHKGHCEFFSTAMVMLLRTNGIPARNVTGFVGGTYNRFGRYYSVREGEAHSWVEAFIEEPSQPGSEVHGTWVTFDPTPASGSQPLAKTSGAWAYMRDLFEAMSQRWSRHVVGYDIYQQMRLFEAARDKLRGPQTTRDQGVRGWLRRHKSEAKALAVIVLIAAAAAWLYRRTRKPSTKKSDSKPQVSAREAELSALYKRLERALQSKGLTRKPAMTPSTFAKLLQVQNHPLAEPVTQMTEVYLGARFGTVELSADELQGLEQTLRTVQTWQPAAKL
jgi:protein-glutamine gamma-glutamyltransferase